MSIETIWHWIGYGLAIAAVLLAVWALWLRDGRKRSRPRCPKCWYDMEGVRAKDEEFAAKEVGRSETTPSGGGAVGCEALSRKGGRESSDDSPLAEANRGRSSARRWLCPECGNQIIGERALHRRRRHWRQAGLAAVLLVAAYGVWTTPRVQRNGWLGAVPTTVLIAALPWSVPAADDAMWSSTWRNIAVSNKGRFPLYFELYQRAEWGAQWWWQWRAIEELCLARVREPLARDQWFNRMSGYENRFLDEGFDRMLGFAVKRSRLAPSVERRVQEMMRLYVRTRDRWQADQPVFVEIGIDRWQWGERDTRLTFEPVDPRLKGFTYVERVSTFVGSKTIGWWRDNLIAAGSAPEGLGSLEYNVRIEHGLSDKNSWEPLCSRRVSIPVRMVASVDEILEPVSQEEARVRFHGQLSEDEPLVSLRGSLAEDWSSEWELELEPDERVFHDFEGVTVAMAVEVMRNGRVMFTGHAWWGWYMAPWGRQGWVRPMGNIRLTSWCGLEPPLDGCWEMHIRADPVLALRNLRGNGYWDGEITMPVEVGVWGQDMNGEWSWKMAR